MYFGALRDAEAPEDVGPEGRFGEREIVSPEEATHALTRARRARPHRSSLFFVGVIGRYEKTLSTVACWCPVSRAWLRASGGAYTPPVRRCFSCRGHPRPSPVGPRDRRELLPQTGDQGARTSDAALENVTLAGGAQGAPDGRPEPLREAR